MLHKTLKKQSFSYFKKLPQNLSLALDIRTYRQDILSEKYFEKEYLITTNLVQDTPIFTDRYYPLEQRMQIVQQEKKAWYELMESRNKVSQHLTSHIKFVYDNATYRLQKQHLVELKNEFNEYGVTSSEYQKLLLTDSCSYEELLNTKRPRVILQERWK